MYPLLCSVALATDSCHNSNPSIQMAYVDFCRHCTGVKVEIRRLLPQTRTLVCVSVAGRPKSVPLVHAGGSARRTGSLGAGARQQ